ncbi:MAG: TIGR02206 family membrane protein [Nocardioidaceae bacterium]|nr:TIGR02206 family membrane protein [Nocardioidaceae bacterium]
MTTAAGDFTTFGPSHLGALALLLVGGLVMVLVGRAQRGRPSAVVLSRVFAVLIPVFTVPLQLLQLTPAEWDLGTSLPFQLCDLAWVFAVHALWTHRRWSVTLTYLWGLTLVTQAMITPDLATDFPGARYLMFWAMHLLIVWASVYLTLGLGIAPRWRDLRSVVAITLTWAVAAFCFNLVVGTNYGYLNAKPARGSVLDLLGPWPGYVVVEIAVVIAAWALLTWPWARRSSRRPEPAHP